MDVTQAISGETIVELKKKGRKPTQTNYFDVREELAVVNFLQAERPEEKNKIYNEFLRKPLDTMISSIIAPGYTQYCEDNNITIEHVIEDI